MNSVIASAKDVSLNSGRYAYIDWAKALCLCLVCFFHFIPAGNIVKVSIYAFHFPAFFFITGYITKDRIVDLKATILKLAQRLLVPYVIYFLISFPLEIFVNSATLTDFLLKFLFVRGETIWNTPIWFMPVYFSVSVIFSVVIYLSNDKMRNIYVFFAGALAFMLAYILDTLELSYAIFGIDRVLHLFVYMCLGYLVRPLKDKIQIMNKKELLQVSVSGLIVFLFAMVISGIKNNGDSIVPSISDFNDFCFYVIFASISILAFFLFLISFKQNRIIEILAKNTVFVISTQYFMLKAWRLVIPKTLLLDSIGGILSICFYVVLLLLLNKFLTPKLSDKQLRWMQYLGIYLK